jgi:hypothetical protein
MCENKSPGPLVEAGLLMLLSLQYCKILHRRSSKVGKHYGIIEDRAIRMNIVAQSICTRLVAYYYLVSRQSIVKNLPFPTRPPEPTLPPQLDGVLSSNLSFRDECPSNPFEI